MRENLTLVLCALILLSGAVMASEPAHATKSASISTTVSADKDALAESLSDLEAYPRIFSPHIRSSELVGDGMARMEIGLDFVTLAADIKLKEQGDLSVIEVTSGDFKGTTLRVELSELPASAGQTDVEASLSLETSWYMDIVASFVSEGNLKSVLYSSLAQLVDHANDQDERGDGPDDHADDPDERGDRPDKPGRAPPPKDDKFCILIFCF